MTRAWLVLLNSTRISLAPNLFYIFAVEFFFTILAVMTTPFVVISFYRAGVIHRNFRIQVCSIALIFVNSAIARAVIFYYQIYDLPPPMTIISSSSLISFETQCSATFADCKAMQFTVFQKPLSVLFFILFTCAGSFGLERIVATIWWKWYEKGSCSTIIVVFLVELCNIVPSAIASTEWLGGNVAYVVNVGHQMVTMFAGCTIFFGGFFYNTYLLRQLSLHKSSQEYSVARTFQIKENVRIFTLITNSFMKAAGLSLTLFATFGFYIHGPPELDSYRFICAALFDLLITLFSLIFLFLAIHLDAVFQKEFNNIGVIVVIRKLLNLKVACIFLSCINALFKIEAPDYQQSALTRKTTHSKVTESYFNQLNSTWNRI